MDAIGHWLSSQLGVFASVVGLFLLPFLAALLISSEMPELLGLADRVAVMHEGALQGILPRAEATQERIMTLALGS